MFGPVAALDAVVGLSLFATSFSMGRIESPPSAANIKEFRARARPPFEKPSHLAPQAATPCAYFQGMLRPPPGPPWPLEAATRAIIRAHARIRHRTRNDKNGFAFR